MVMRRRDSTPPENRRSDGRDLKRIRCPPVAKDLRSYPPSSFGTLCDKVIFGWMHLCPISLFENYNERFLGVSFGPVGDGPVTPLAPPRTTQPSHFRVFFPLRLRPSTPPSERSFLKKYCPNSRTGPPRFLSGDARCFATLKLTLLCLPEKGPFLSLCCLFSRLQLTAEMKLFSSKISVFVFFERDLVSLCKSAADHLLGNVLNNRLFVFFPSQFPR